MPLPAPFLPLLSPVGYNYHDSTEPSARRYGYLFDPRKRTIVIMLRKHVAMKGVYLPRVYFNDILMIAAVPPDDKEYHFSLRNDVCFITHNALILQRVSISDGDGDEEDPRWISRWTTNCKMNSHEPSLGC